MPAPDDRPNILLITSDQQHYSALGFANPRISTPALDRLAREGMVFDRAYCNNPTCTPSRATIITGQYPSWHGAWALGTRLMEDRPVVGDLFREAGYSTSLIGKAHFHPLAETQEYPSIECFPYLRDLDFWRNFQGPWYGFEHVETSRMHAQESLAGGHYAIWMQEKGFTDWPMYFEPPPGHKAPTPWAPPHHDASSWKLPEQYHYTTWTGERTCDRIRSDVAAGKPFFCWSSFHDPHPPYAVPEPWASMYNPADMEPGELSDDELALMPPPHQMTQQPEDPQWWGAFRESGHHTHGYHSHLHTREQMQQWMAIYYGMVSFMDHQIGRILDTLDELGVADNTLIVFTSDHGHFLGQHGLRAKGAFHYEDVLRVPFLVRHPARVPAGRRSDALQALIDLPSTFLAAADLEVPGYMQGIDQGPVWRGEQQALRHDVLVEFRHQPTAVHLRTYITDRYKLTLYRDRDWGELFDLQEDPREIHNRFDDPDFVQIRCQLMRQWLNAEMVREPMVMPRIAVA